MPQVVIESANAIAKDSKDAFLEQVVSAEKNTWPPELQASREKFESRLNIFPDGFFVVKLDGKIHGVSTSQITTYDPTSSRSWDEITDSGMIAKTHDSQGNSLYVVSVGVTKDSQGKGIGGILVKEQVGLAKKLGLKYLFLGARAPGYDAYCKAHGEASIEDYLKKQNEKGEPIDPEIRFYKRQGLHVAKIIPNFEPDTQSRGYGVVMLWENS